MESSRLLPIGSVITLTDAEKKLMVIGTEVEREDDENIYDYVGVPFPEGYIDSEIMFCLCMTTLSQLILSDLSILRFRHTEAVSTSWQMKNKRKQRAKNEFDICIIYRSRRPGRQRGFNRGLQQRKRTLFCPLRRTWRSRYGRCGVFTGCRGFQESI